MGLAHWRGRWFGRPEPKRGSWSFGGWPQELWARPTRRTKAAEGAGLDRRAGSFGAAWRLVGSAARGGFGLETICASDEAVRPAAEPCSAECNPAQAEAVRVRPGALFSVVIFPARFLLTQILKCN